MLKITYDCSLHVIHNILYQVYHVKGLLGRATDNFTTDGTLLQKTTYSKYGRVFL